MHPINSSKPKKRKKSWPTWVKDKLAFHQAEILPWGNSSSSYCGCRNKWRKQTLDQKKLPFISFMIKLLSFVFNAVAFKFQLRHFFAIKRPLKLESKWYWRSESRKKLSVKLSTLVISKTLWRNNVIFITVCLGGLESFLPLVKKK
jgi:hypothetical protein